MTEVVSFSFTQTPRKTQFLCVHTFIFPSNSDKGCLFSEGAGEVPLHLFALSHIWLRSSAILEYLKCTRFCQLQVLDGFLVCRG